MQRDAVVDPAGGRRSRRALLVLLLVVVIGVIALEVRARTVWHDAAVVEVFTVAGSTRMLAQISSCGVEDRVEVTETADTVTLFGERQGENNDDCLDGQAVACLDAPIGSRRVVDQASRGLVPVTLVDSEPLIEGTTVADPCP